MIRIVAPLLCSWVALAVSGDLTTGETPAPATTSATPPAASAGPSSSSTQHPEHGRKQWIQYDPQVVADWWDPSGLVIGCTLGGLVVIATVVAVCCCCCSKPTSKDKLQDRLARLPWFLGGTKPREQKYIEREEERQVQRAIDQGLYSTYGPGSAELDARIWSASDLYSQSNFQHQPSSAGSSSRRPYSQSNLPSTASSSARQSAVATPRLIHMEQRDSSGSSRLTPTYIESGF